jgi:hypothetical protein
MKRMLPVLLLLASILAIAPPTQAAKRPKLRAFKDCGQLVGYGRAHRPNYESGGQPASFEPSVSRPTAVGGDRPTSTGGEQPQSGSAPQPAESGGDASGDFSLTNNQEAGVFEPDVIKTDGQNVFALNSAGVLETVDVRGTPALLAELALPQGYGHQMLLYHGRLLVSWSDFQGNTMLGLVNVADPSKPVLEKTLAVNGYLVAMRRTEQTIRVVLSVTPRAIGEPGQPQPVDAVAAKRTSWVPRGTLRNVRKNTSARRTLVGCKKIRRPRSFAGLEELTVLTINIDKGLDPVDADAVMTGGGVVYSSAQNLYVATQQYSPAVEDQTSGPAPQGMTTQVHRFSLDDADNTTYRGSGGIPGYVLNQFSMSEKDGVLRVASTDVPPWFVDGNPSHSLVTTLAVEPGSLDQVGQVDGLGKGERIFAVRFFGDAGYVVTFRQVDPLYTVDLSDPAKPAVRGELKIPGVSTYLHPIAGDRLIGVGTGPSDDEQDFGLQLSEFDVSNLADPKLEQRITVDGGNSEAGYDHHAFTWWQPRNLAVLPVQIYRYSEPSCAPEQPCPAYYGYEESFGGAIGYSVTPGAIAEVGRADHKEAVVRRSIIMGTRLLTMSDAGLQANNLDGYAEVGFAAFTPPPNNGGCVGPGGGGGGTEPGGVSSSPTCVSPGR